MPRPRPMRYPSVAAVALCLLATVSEAQTDQSFAVIWAGGKTHEEVDKALADYTKRENEWSSFIALADGYPKVVLSQDYPGLNPGFLIVLLGICGRDPSDNPAVRALDAFEPALYTRALTETHADACPRALENDEDQEQFRAAISPVTRLQGRGSELTAFTVSTPATRAPRRWTCDGGSSPSFEGAPAFSTRRSCSPSTLFQKSMEGGCRAPRSSFATRTLTQTARTPRTRGPRRDTRWSFGCRSEVALSWSPSRTPE